LQALAQGCGFEEMDKLAEEIFVHRITKHYDRSKLRQSIARPLKILVQKKQMSHTILHPLLKAFFDPKFNSITLINSAKYLLKHL
jgi:hypothetical protein